MARTIALVGALHPGAAQLALALEDEPGVERILGLQPAPAPLLGPKFEHVEAEPGDQRFDAALAHADVLVVFPVLQAGDREGRAARERLVATVRRSLDAAHQASAVVLWSSGIVYGAHPDNPVPLDEDAPLRPNFDFPPARTSGGLAGGVYNVAPDDSVTAVQAGRLAGKRRVEVPEGAAFAVGERLAPLGVAISGPGELHFHMHPWVLSNGRLREAGWAPRWTTAEAMTSAGHAVPAGVRVGRMQVRRSDVIRGAAAAAAFLAALAALARRSRGGRA